MSKPVIPQHCIVHAVELTPAGATVRYRCVREGMMETGQHWYERKTPEGHSERGNYPIVHLKKIRVVKYRGATTSGNGSRVDFVLSPDSVTCRREGRELVCQEKGSAKGFSGVRKAKKKRRSKRRA